VPTILQPHSPGNMPSSAYLVLTVDLRSGTVCYDITVSGIGEPTELAAGIGSAHIHSYTQNGAIAVDLKTQFVAVADAADTYQATDCVTAPRRVLVDILLHPKQAYVNVHTVEFPGGAIQGDLA
jgi:CHRD domain-containing protein